MDKHYCICIGRKFCSGGRNVAALVAERLGIKVYDRTCLRMQPRTPVSAKSSLMRPMRKRPAKACALSS